MRFNSKNTIFTLLLCIFLMSIPVAAQKSSELTFPQIEGWEKSGISTYPVAELGYSVAYQSEEAGTVTIYVYNGGHKKIADGIDDKLVKKEIEKAGSDIEAIGKMGRYDNVKKIKSDSITLGGGKTKALYSLYNFEVGGNEVDSEIYLFGYQNNFIKIRATRPKGENGAENAELKSFLAEIDKLFSK